MLTGTKGQRDGYTLHALMQLTLTLNIQTWADEISVEHQLKNNSIADIYFRWGGDEFIIEVKTEYKQSLIESAMAKYWSQCDYLLFAAPEQKIPKDKSEHVWNWASPSLKKIGLIAIGYHGLELIRTPERLKRKPGLNG